MFCNFRKEISKFSLFKKICFFGVLTLGPTWGKKIWLGTSSVCFGYIGELLMEVNKKQQVVSISDMSPFQNKSTSDPVSSTKSSYFSLISKMIQQLSRWQWSYIQQWILLDINTLLFGCWQKWAKNNFWTPTVIFLQIKWDYWHDLASVFGSNVPLVMLINTLQVWRKGRNCPKKRSTLGPK